MINIRTNKYGRIFIYCIPRNDNYAAVIFSRLIYKNLKEYPQSKHIIYPIFGINFDGSLASRYPKFIGKLYWQILNLLATAKTHATAKTQRGFTPSARGYGPGVKSINERLDYFRLLSVPEIHYGTKRKRNDEQQGDPSKCRRVRDSKVTHEHDSRRQPGLFNRHQGYYDSKRWDVRDFHHERCPR